VNLEDFRDLKTTTFEIFLKEVYKSFITETLPSIDYKANQYLIQDFDGNTFSEFFNDVTKAFETNLEEI